MRIRVTIGVEIETHNEKTGSMDYKYKEYDFKGDMNSFAWNQSFQKESNSISFSELGIGNYLSVRINKKFLEENISNIKYVVLNLPQKQKWKIKKLDLRYPRLLISLDSPYEGGI